MYVIVPICASESRIDEVALLPLHQPVVPTEGVIIATRRSWLYTVVSHNLSELLQPNFAISLLSGPATYHSRSSSPQHSNRLIHGLLIPFKPNHFDLVQADFGLY